MTEQNQQSPTPPGHPSDAMDRRWPRRACRLDAALVILDEGEPAVRIPVKVCDISQGGAGLTLDIPVDRGTPLVLVLGRPVSGNKRALYAVAAGCTQEINIWRVGIEFLPTPLQIRCQPWYCRLNAA